MVPTAVTFDLDDTLAVVDRDRADILDAAARAVGVEGLSREAYLRAHRRHHANHSRAPIFEALLQEIGAEEVDANALATAYRRRIGDAIEPVTGVESLLDHLTDERPVGLVTNGPIRAQRAKLERLAWLDRFDAIVISGAVGAAKPAAEPFLEACRQLGVEPAETLHVGDHPRDDAAGARNAGLSAALVTTGAQRPDAAIPTIPRDRLADGVTRHLAAIHPA